MTGRVVAVMIACAIIASMGMSLFRLLVPFPYDPPRRLDAVNFHNHGVISKTNYYMRKNGQQQQNIVQVERNHHQQQVSRPLTFPHQSSTVEKTSHTDLNTISGNGEIGAVKPAVLVINKVKATNKAYYVPPSPGSSSSAVSVMAQGMTHSQPRTVSPPRPPGIPTATTAAEPRPISPSHSSKAPKPKQQAQNHQAHKHKSHHDDPDTFALPSLPKEMPWSQYHPRNKIVAFYNLYIGGNMYADIVHEQLDLMNMTGLLDRLDVVYYVTIGSNYETMTAELQNRLQTTKPLYDLLEVKTNFPTSFPTGPNEDMVNSKRNVNSDSTSDPSLSPTYAPTAPPTSSPSFTPTSSLLKLKKIKFRHLHNSVPSVDETLTLSYLYLFCSQNRESIVLYFHDKGSFNFRTENIYFRNFLDCYVLNTHCLDALEDSNNNLDICGWRFSPVPNPHYSGNFWWAKCSYVNSLFHPGSMALNTTFADITNSLSHGIVSSRRYLPEAWIGSGPRVQPADCMDHSVDTSFLCCYDLNDISIRQCPNHAKNYYPGREMMDSVPYAKLSMTTRKKLQELSIDPSTSTTIPLKIGARCKTSDVISHSGWYRDAYDRNRGFHEHHFRTDMVSELKRRSILWYGQYPETLMNVTREIERLDYSTLPSQAFIQEPFYKVSYFYDQGKLYDAKTSVYAVASVRGRRETIPSITMSNFKINLLRAHRGHNTTS